MPFFDGWLIYALKSELNISLIARDEESGALLGVIIMEHHAQEVESEDKEDDVPEVRRPEVRRPEVRRTPRHKERPEKYDAIFTFLDWIRSGLDVARDYGEKEWLNLTVICCDTHTRTPGLGTQLCLRGVEAARERGFKVLCPDVIIFIIIM